MRAQFERTSKKNENVRHDRLTANDGVNEEIIKKGSANVYTDRYNVSLMGGVDMTMLDKRNTSLLGTGGNPERVDMEKERVISLRPREESIMGKLKDRIREFAGPFNMDPVYKVLDSMNGEVDIVFKLDDKNQPRVVLMDMNGREIEVKMELPNEELLMRRRRIQNALGSELEGVVEQQESLEDRLAERARITELYLMNAMCKVMEEILEAGEEGGLGAHMDALAA